MASKRFTLRSVASISLLSWVALAISAQTAIAQLPPQRLRAGGSRISSSGPSFWFKQYCASCHGVDGAGDGPVAPSLKTKPSDLRLLSKNNGGAFPERDVHDFIDGTKIVTAHGSREMPVWGYPTTFQPGTPGLSREAIDTRIKLLVDYVKSIQKK